MLTIKRAALILLAVILLSFLLAVTYGATVGAGNLDGGTGDAANRICGLWCTNPPSDAAHTDCVRRCLDVLEVE